MRLIPLILMTLFVATGCTPKMHGNTQVASLPEPLTDVRLVYVKNKLYPQPSQARSAIANFLNPSGNYSLADSSAFHATNQHDLLTVDEKVLRLAPAILQQQGLKGDVTSFITPSHTVQAADAAAAAAKARGANTEYWLVISPSEARAGGLITSVDFRAVLSNIVDRKVYWQADYSTPGNPVDDAQVQAMLTAFIQELKRQP